jgi:molecular chaperone DnaJ
MAAINEAWSVLGNPARRREYDLTLVGPPAAEEPPFAAGAPPFREPRLNPLARYQDPPRFPWRLMGIMGLVGVGFVILGVATASEPTPPVVDNVLRPGDCVAIQPNGDAAEVLCTAPHDGTLVELVTGLARCPDGTAAHRDRQGMGTACVQLD